MLMKKATLLFFLWVSVPVMAHDYIDKINEYSLSLDTQGERLRVAGCNQKTLNMCSVETNIRLSRTLLTTLPENASNHELLERLSLVSDALSVAQDEFVLKGVYEGLGKKQADISDQALTEVMHTSGYILILMGEIEKAEEKK